MTKKSRSSYTETPNHQVSTNPVFPGQMGLKTKQRGGKKWKIMQGCLGSKFGNAKKTFENRLRQVGQNKFEPTRLKKHGLNEL